MKTAKKEDMRKEYKLEDLGKGIRGKYFEEYKKGTNLVLLSPDVAAACQPCPVSFLVIRGDRAFLF